MSTPLTVRISRYDRIALDAQHTRAMVGRVIKPTTFRLGRVGHDYVLIDTDTFNTWKPQGPFASRDDAIVWAWRAHDFKCGRRQSGDLATP